MSSRLRQTLTKRPAVSLVIAMIMVLAFMMMTADIMQGMMRTQSIAKGAKFSDQAQLNAQDGIELGLYAQNKPKEFQATLKAMLANDPTLKLNGNTLTDAQGNTTSWKTTDQVTGGEGCYETTFNKGTDNTMAGCADKYFVYPYPGTGTVGGKDCDIKTQQLRKNTPWLEDMYYLINKTKYVGPDITSDSFLNSVNNLNTLDHPCLWNTLKTGVSAEIPLFRIDPNGDEIGADNITDFYVRARLPCKSGSACLEKDRWVLKVTQPGNYNIRALIWNIVSGCTSDSLCYLSEYDDKQLSLTNSVITYGILGKPSYNFQIKNWILGFENDGDIIKGQDGTKDQNIGSIKNFLSKGAPWAGADISRPFFHLSIAAPLTVESISPGQTVDSIEYQIIYKQKPNLPPLITNPTVVSQGSSGGYTVSLQSSLTKQTGSFNFSLVGK